MNFLESKGVRVESVRPMVGSIKNNGPSPQSYHLFIGDDEQEIEVGTPNENLYTQAREIDPDDVDAVFHYLKTMRDRIDWLI